MSRANSTIRLTGRYIGNGKVEVSMSLDQPSNIILHLTTISGRSVFTAERQTAVCGPQKMVFESGTLAKGIYCCKVQAGQLTSQSRLVTGR